MEHAYNMGIIGNCAYLSYVDKQADIKWMCWPRFDSSFVFGSLLDEQKGGHFYIKPVSEQFESRQYYLKNTNVLCTEFHCNDGVFRVIDFAPRFYNFERYFKPLALIRKVELIEGHPNIEICCQPSGEYGKVEPKPYHGSNHIEYLGLDRPLRLTTDFPLNYILSKRAVILDKTRYCYLAYGLPLEAPLESTCEGFFLKTKEYWESWINNATIPNLFQSEVIRSALTLKLHQYEDTGAIIAAGTTSLPEHPGAGRNWDYRFCWLRDTYYTLRALNNLGHFEELVHYAHYIQNVAGIGEKRYQPVYSITGDPATMEERITELAGYLGNQPVRIGNQASEHIQNDVYGQVMMSLLPLYTDERFVDKDEVMGLRLSNSLLKKIEETIDEADSGLWEFRNKTQKHCYTFLFHWAGSQAAKKIGEKFNNPVIIQKAERLAKMAEMNIESCYKDQDKVYTQAVGSTNLDASLYQLITLQYLDPLSEKARDHLNALEKALGADDNILMYRYKHRDDFGKPKSTFLVCAFWYVEALAAIGEVEKAVEKLEQLIKFSNHLGLFSEDVDAETKSQWGNFPQSYSHVGLINCAFMISYKLNKPDFLV